MGVLIQTSVDRCLRELEASDAGRPGRGDATDVTPQVIYRDTVDRQVVALRIWRTPLYRRDDQRATSAGAAADRQWPVLVAATDRGGISIYETTRGDKARVSASNNFYFRGMRHDRIWLREPLSLFLPLEGERHFAAATARGQVMLGRLCYTRDSVDRDDPEEPRSGDCAKHVLRRGGPAPECPEKLWPRLHVLFENVAQHKTFYRPAEASPQLKKLELLELIHVEEGALRRYLLRERYMVLQPWDRMRADPAVPGDTACRAIEREARRQLDRLDPNRPDDKHCMKIILKTLGRRLIDRPLRELFDDFMSEAEEKTRVRGDERMETAVRILASSIGAPSPRASTATGRVRIAAFKEMFRVNLLRHLPVLAGDVQALVAESLRRCLNDEQRLVRVETLRAVAVALRNIGILKERLGPRGETFFKQVFATFESAGWLVELLCEQLQRYPVLTRQTILPTAWYYISALMHIYRLFPQHRWLLCEMLTRKSPRTEVLSILEARLARELSEGDGESRRLFLAPLRLSQMSGTRINEGRATFIATFEWSRFTDTLAEARITPVAYRPSGGEPDDAAVAFSHREARACFAQMYAVGNIGDVQQLARRCKVLRDQVPTDQGSPHPHLFLQPAASIELLLELAQDLRLPQNPMSEENRRMVERIGQTRDLLSRPAADGSCLTNAEVEVTREILDLWQTFYEREEPMEGDPCVGGRLGLRLRSGSYGAVFRRMFSNGEQDGACVVKVCRHPLDDDRKRAFVKGARLNKELSDDHPDLFVVIHDIVTDEPYPHYTMERCEEGSLRDYLDSRSGASGPRLTESDWLEIALAAAADLGEALAIAHAHDKKIRHRDIHAGNVLVKAASVPARRLQVRFKMADFDLATSVSSLGRHSADPVVHDFPKALRERTADPVLTRRSARGDVLALAVLLFEIISGEKIRETTRDREGDAVLLCLCTLLDHLLDAGQLNPEERRLLGALKMAFDPGRAFPFADGRAFRNALRGEQTVAPAVQEGRLVENPVEAARPLAAGGLPKRKWDACLVYAGCDKDRAEAFHQSLSTRDRIFFARRSVPSGADWTIVEQKAFEEAPCLIVFVTATARWNEDGENPWVKEEISNALDGRKKIIPVIADYHSDKNKPPGLRSRQYLLLYEVGLKAALAEVDRHVEAAAGATTA